MSRLADMGVKVFGQPPPKDAPRSAQLRWVRRFYGWGLLFGLPACAGLVARGSQTWMLVVVGIGALLWLQGFASINVQIRRALRGESLRTSDASSSTE
jgi:hypothetical protein